MVSCKYLRRELSASDSHSLHTALLQTCSPSSIKIATSIPLLPAKVKPQRGLCPLWTPLPERALPSLDSPAKGSSTLWTPFRGCRRYVISEKGSRRKYGCAATRIKSLFRAPVGAICDRPHAAHTVQPAPPAHTEQQTRAQSASQCRAIGAHSRQDDQREPGRPREERKAAPPVADAAAWSSNEAQSSDSFSWLNDNAEL